jgi:hypothetical protein
MDTDVIPSFLILVVDFMSELTYTCQHGIDCTSESGELRLERGYEKHYEEET